MPKLTWDQVGKRYYEAGTSKGVLFPMIVSGESAGTYAAGVAWNGLVSVKQSPDGAEENAKYANNIKYLSLTSAENFKGSIDAFTYPDEFAACDGSKEVGADTGVFLGQQKRSPFGLVYSTILGNDTEGEAHGEMLHFIYNAKVAPSERAYETINEDPDAITFSWEFTTTPVAVAAEGFEPTAYLRVNTTKLAAAKVKSLQDMIYGTEAVPAALPTIDEIITLVNATP